MFTANVFYDEKILEIAIIFQILGIKNQWPQWFNILKLIIPLNANDICPWKLKNFCSVIESELVYRNFFTFFINIKKRNMAYACLHLSVTFINIW